MLNKPVPPLKSALDWLQVAGLGVVALATVIAVIQHLVLMVAAHQVTLADLLLLFIYLEVLAMVGIYLESGQLPVRLPLYIAIVALARYLALDMRVMDTWKIVAAAVLLIRYGHVKYPYEKDARHSHDDSAPGELQR